MDTVTYPDAEIEQLLNDRFVPFKPDIGQEGDLAKRFLVVWTPGLLFLDGAETIHYRAYGYHPPREFAALARIALGTVEFHRGNYAEAASHFAEVAEGNGSSFGPEALYWRGICEYKAGNMDGLVQTWNSLMDDHPDSLWAHKVSFLRG